MRTYITQETVIKLLHSHADMIKLNPLVTNFQTCDPPTNSPADEHDFIWYEITDKVAYLPWNLLSGEVTFKASFCDLPMGLRTHIYAPMGLDMKECWSVESMSTDPTGADTETQTETITPGRGLAGSSEGLCLREDIDMQCNMLMTWFVKRTLKEAHTTLIDQLVLRFNQGDY
ncbi:hypothetical protein N7481_007595 [Penicillium waksmanii]|uniref:uncharacterized protein n=1 Tax=Penicillium waksmanii TaxID=69791 RepID=UPI002548875C|nr:uncharacterized protein N7481_007595 [Penicillium waksmanii]KAJ5980297.1 hypothetical protein N7481_007595 [Penicillium waksmanii]